MYADTKTLVHARVALQKAIRGWVNDPNVRLIDIGWPERCGNLLQDELAIRFHVAKKFEEGIMLEAATRQGATQGAIPETIGGFPVDVPEGPYQLNQWYGGGWQPPTNLRATRVAPLQGGISIANARLSGYGTLGGAVVDRETGSKMILSNWHVLAGRWYGRSGKAVYQPGLGDGGKKEDTVALLSRDAMVADLDAAVAELIGDRDLVNNQIGLGPVNGVSWAILGMDVVKSGRRTEVTYGRVTGVEGTTSMTYGGGIRRLIRNVIVIEPRSPGTNVSAGGDSGSFWLHEETMNVVGLHFAGSDRPERALAIDMQPILDALNVNILV